MNTETKIKTISYSEVACYQQCSLKHKLRYIEKIESEYIDQALILGSCCHSAIESCLKKYKMTDKLMNVIELQQIFTDSLKYQAKEKKIRYPRSTMFATAIVPVANMGTIGTSGEIKSGRRCDSY